MEYLQQKLQYFTFFVKNTEENKERKGSKYNIYFEQIFKVLSWEDNTLSLATFLVVNFLFWLIVFFEIRLLGLVFFTILIVFLLDSYYEKMNVSRGQYEESFEEIYTYFKDLLINLKVLRKESPSSFCLGMSLTFLFMSFLAKNVSGYILLYISILLIFFLPLGYKVLPEEYKEYLKNSLKSLNNVRGVLAEEELIPFISNKDFNNKDADLDSLLTDRTADSATNSLVSGISAMPSYLDVVENPNELEEEDLIPVAPLQQQASRYHRESSTESDSDHRDINFDSTHFNGDTSSEDEKFLGPDMRFPSDVADASHSRANAGSALGGVLSNFAAVGSNFVTNALISAISNKPTNPVERKNSSSDSEFEIINSDDVRE